MDGIELELMWSRLRSIVSERAKAMQRTAFSPTVREAGDLAYGLFDARARMIAQADTGTPGHINCMAHCGYEGTAVEHTISSPLTALNVFLFGPRLEGEMAPELPVLLTSPVTPIDEDVSRDMFTYEMLYVRM